MCPPVRPGVPRDLRARGCGRNGRSRGRTSGPGAPPRRSLGLTCQPVSRPEQYARLPIRLGTRCRPTGPYGAAAGVGRGRESWAGVGCFVCTTTAVDPCCCSPVGATARYFRVQIPCESPAVSVAAACDATHAAPFQPKSWQVRRGTTLQRHDVANAGRDTHSTGRDPVFPGTRALTSSPAAIGPTREGKGGERKPGKATTQPANPLGARTNEGPGRNSALQCESVSGCPSGRRLFRVLRPGLARPAGVRGRGAVGQPKACAPQQSSGRSALPSPSTADCAPEKLI